MQRNFAGKNSLWRAFVGCVVAYALIINALLSSVLGAEWVAQAAAGLIGEHCLTDARAAGADPEPAEQSDDSTHCAFCTLTAGAAVLPPVAPQTALIVLPRASAPGGVSDRDLIHWSGHPGKLPRGPPQAATEA
jgi:Protein of unknown function (DUF2946)